MNFLRLRRTPKLAVPKHETEILFADADGVLKQMGPDGSVVEVGSGGGGGSMPVLEDPGHVWSAGLPVTEGYRIAATINGHVRVFETTASGTIIDNGSVFPDDYSPSLRPLAETVEDDVTWRYLGIVGDISWEDLPPQLPEEWTVDGNGNLSIATASDFDDNAQVLTIKARNSPDDLNTVEVYSAGNGDWYFLEEGGAGSLDFWRLEGSDVFPVVRIQERGLLVTNATASHNLFRANNEDNVVQIADSDSTLSFFRGAGAAKQTGVAVSAAGIHAALVSYGLIAA